jgi:hypothetical protein
MGASTRKAAGSGGAAKATGCTWAGVGTGRFRGGVAGLRFDFFTAIAAAKLTLERAAARKFSGQEIQPGWAALQTPAVQFRLSRAAEMK